jgi:hypothetical protein
MLSATDMVEGVPGTLRQDLKTVVTTALNVPRFGGSNIGLDLEQDDQVVRATVGGSPSGSDYSAGLRILLGLAAAPFDDRLARSPFAVITYAESALDDDLASAVWRLFTRLLGNGLLGNVRTLVILLEASRVNYGLHCSAGSSLWARISANGFEIRKEWESDQAQIGLLRRFEDELVVFFLGAGFSASSRLPLGDGLRDEALALLMNSSDSYDEVARRFYEFLRVENRLLPSETTMALSDFVTSLTLERVLREEVFRFGAPRSPTLLGFRDKNNEAIPSPGRSVSALERLIQRQSKIVLVTVNFDTLIESTQRQNIEIFASDDDFKRCPEYLRQYREHGGRVPLLKLHGTIDDLDTIVATVDQVSRGLAVPKAEALREIVRLNGESPTGWIYVGYSMRDPDITNLLSLREFGQRLDEAWVSPFIIPTAQRFAERSRIYEASDPDFWQRSITETADVFFEELESVWPL